MGKGILVLLVLIGVAGAVFFFYPEARKQVGFDVTPIRVGIQPLGSISANEVDSVANAVEKMYGFESVILMPCELPHLAYTEVRYPRYRADSLVRWLPSIKPDSITYILGLTNKDISVTKYEAGTKEIKDPVWKYKDFGIFGLGSVGGVACVVSSNRLHKGVSDKTFYTRLTRISCHEMGHVFGLRHCPKANCLMNDANESIKTIDNSTGVLCPACWAEIH